MNSEGFWRHLTELMEEVNRLKAANEELVLLPDRVAKLEAENNKLQSQVELISDENVEFDSSLRETKGHVADLQKIVLVYGVRKSPIDLFSG